VEVGLVPEPRYLGIAADLRRRIKQGELVAGAKVPSVRKLAADWGVAAATAAKALDTLSHEGLVHPQPRSGFVVAGAQRVAAKQRVVHRPVARQQDLTRERLVRAAIEIADAEGLAAVSIRSVTARLGVATMAPYRHVKGKDELIVLMADAAFGERGYPAQAPEEWRARLELGARTLWSLFRRHPWLAQLGPITRPLPLPNLAVHSEWVLSTLEGFGMGAAAMCDLNVLFFSYIQGIAIHLEREQQAFSASGRTEDDWIDDNAVGLQAIADMERYPAFGRMLGTLAVEGYDLVLDDLFELGLRSMLDGLAIRFGQDA
jgi:DNA-binding transcriptional regulator YhcF (GntR family)